MNTSLHLQHLQQQGAPVLLLAELLRRNPGLPAETYRIDNIGRPLLAVLVHGSVRTDFETWRTALGLPVSGIGETWLLAEGVVDDVRVELKGFGTPDEIAAVAELAEAVALVGALPMPTGVLAEDPHDSPLHHSYALGRDLPAVSW